MGRRRVVRGLLFHATTALFLGLVGRPAEAVPIHGIDFPAGPISFVDAMISYIVGSPAPSAPHRDPLAALGVPDIAGDFNCAGDPHCPFVSLGSGGSIVLQFLNNSLTGSGNSANDLHIFETGPDVEDAFIDISKNGVDWFSIGKILGATSSIDIDAFGFGTADFFSFVRITDDPNEGVGVGTRIGADIDAVGAISSGPPQSGTTTTVTPTTTTTIANTTTIPVTTTVPPGTAPEPGTLLLLGAGLGAWALAKGRRRS